MKVLYPRKDVPSRQDPLGAYAYNIDKRLSMF